MAALIFICIIETIIGGYIIRKLLKERNIIERTTEESSEVVYSKTKEIQREKEKNVQVQLSLRNANNLHEFVNNIVFKETYSHQRYIKIYQKELEYREITQMIWFINTC